MKATDLRIGNWVKSKLHDGLETEVFSVYHQSVKLGANPLALYKQDEIEQIPLTEEWLVKFGFDKVGTHFIYDRFSLHYMPAYKFWYVNDLDSGFYITKVEFVHEIQNVVFTLNSHELTIK